jgi:hypothetical protein
MRQLLLAAVLVLTASGGAFAYCPVLPSDQTAGSIEDQEAVMLCQQQALAAATADRERELQQQGALQAQQQQFEFEQRMQQTFSAAQGAASQPQF